MHKNKNNIPYNISCYTCTKQLHTHIHVHKEVVKLGGYTYINSGCYCRLGQTLCTAESLTMELFLKFSFSSGLVIIALYTNTIFIIGQCKGFQLGFQLHKCTCTCINNSTINNCVVGIERQNTIYMYLSKFQLQTKYHNNNINSTCTV